MLLYLFKAVGGGEDQRGVWCRVSVGEGGGSVGANGFLIYVLERLDMERLNEMTNRCVGGRALRPVGARSSGRVKGILVGYSRSTIYVYVMIYMVLRS